MIQQFIWSGYAWFFAQAIRINLTHQLSLKRIVYEVLNENPNTLIDIGCGTAELLRHLRAAGWSGHYTGVDLSSVMLEHAPEDENSTFIVCDVLRYGDKCLSSHYEMAVSHNAMYNWSHEQAVQGVALLLKVSDLVVLTNPYLVDPEAVAKGSAENSHGSSKNALTHLWRSLSLGQFLLLFFTLLYFNVFIRKDETIISLEEWQGIIHSFERITIVYIDTEVYAGTGVLFKLRQ